jgi:thymidylate kinase
MYQAKQSPLTLIDRLCAALDAEGVVCCQWKGHRKLNRWLSGEGDVDLLVARADAGRFEGVVCRLGFKQALAPPGRQIPGVAHFYGFEPKADRLIHLHLHYQLVFGHHATLNYRLPFERQLLESALPGRYFPVPAPEFELILFVVRTVVGCSPLASAFRGRPGLPNAARDELESLLSRADPARTKDILERHLPFIEAAFFDACTRTLRRECSTWALLNLKRRLCSRLKAHVRRPPLVDFLRRLGHWGVNRVRSAAGAGPQRGRPAAGGKLVAIVGGDGAGKSTAIEGLDGWLSARFSTSKVHLGKPPKSGLTLAVAVMRRAGLHFGRLFERRSARAPEVCDGSEFPGYLLLLRSLCIARDRYRLYVKARRAATNGGLVICDRYPMPQIKSMDGPNIGRLAGRARSNRITRFLQRAEAAYYKHIAAPDLLIVLRLRPEVAARRKTDEDSDYVRARSREVWELDLGGTGAHVLDAARPKSEVLSDLKTLVWREL